MQMKAVLLGLVGLVAISEASVIAKVSPHANSLERRQNRGGNNGGNNNNNNNNNNNDANPTCLAPGALQTGSQQPGGQNGQANDGQALSKTDQANFINFCNNLILTNGEQKTGGSCNGIPMGNIPAQNKMVSAMMIFPPHNGNIQANQEFDIQVRVNNLQAGSFTDAQKTYYSAPQDVNGQGIIIGHVHVTVQDLGNSLTPQQPLDASKFVFFKGINDAGQNGLLRATVAGGLPAGNYRVCSLTGASNHQPVLMPVAQRGAQDDCNKFTVGGNNNNNNNNNNQGGNQGGNQGNNNQGGNNNNQGNQGANTGGGNQGNNNANGGNQGGNQGGNNQAGNGNGGGQGGATANALGGIQAPAVTNSGNSARPFSVQGNTFTDKSSAVQRACDIQNNLCSDGVNRKTINGVTLQQCNSQVAKCVSDLS